MKDSYWNSLLAGLSLTAAVEVSLCVLPPPWGAEGGLAAGAIAGAVAAVALMITAVGFLVLLAASLILSRKLSRRTIIVSFLVLDFLILPAAIAGQMLRGPERSAVGVPDASERMRVEEELRRKAEIPTCSLVDYFYQRVLFPPLGTQSVGSQVNVQVVL